MSDNSSKKLDVGFIRKPDGKKWVYVDLIKYGNPAPRFIPAFHDLWRIIQAIAQCEDESYPPPKFKGRGRLVEFLSDAVHEKDFAVLARKYQIPEREGDRVVKTNGAAVDYDGPVQAPIKLTADDIPW